MTNTTRFEFGDIILVPFPFTDQSAAKKRPAVVVSSKAYHRERPDVILMAITSQQKPKNTIGEVAIQKWKQAGLLKPSVLKPLITTIERSLILRKMGKLESTDRKALEEVLQAILGK
jgi:mRNA interferase MazF